MDTSAVPLRVVSACGAGGDGDVPVWHSACRVWPLDDEAAAETVWRTAPAPAVRAAAQSEHGMRARSVGMDHPDQRPG